MLLLMEINKLNQKVCASTIAQVDNIDKFMPN